LQRRLLIVAGGAVAAAVILVVVLHRPARKPPVHYQRPVPVPVAEAFERGGVPVHDPQVQRAIEDLASAFASGGVMDPQPAAIVARGESLALAWHDMVAALAEWRTGTSDDRDDVRGTVGTTSELLGPTGFQLHLRFGSEGAAWLEGYRIDDVGFVTAGGAPVRVLGVRRMDGIRGAHGALGLESPDMGPVLMLDPIESYAISDVLPVLAPGAPFRFTGPPAQIQRVATIAGEAVRKELAASLGGDADVAVRIAQLIAERARIIDRWQEVPVHMNELYLPPSIDPRRHDDGARVTEIEDELARLQAERIADRLAEIVAASVRRHEAQHRVDMGRTTPLPYPAVLADLDGPVADDDGKPSITVQFARAELIAYLSQILNDPVTPQLTLWGVAVFAISHPSSPEGTAGEILVEGLARHLGATRGEGMRDHAWFTAAAETCARATGAQLRAAARELWVELYGEPPVDIVDR
jgi:hypothetical protein